MNAITVTFFADAQARSKREEAVQLEDLVGMIRSTTAGAKADLPWLKLARFDNIRSDKGALRHDANVLSISGVELDYDGETVSFDEAVEIAEKASLRAIVYTSPSHTAEKPRWRVLAPASGDIPSTERTRLASRINGLYGGVFAPESFTLSQAYYFGRIGYNPAHQVELVDGQCVDELDELDLIAVGKPNGSAGSHTTADGDNGGPINVAELENEIVTGSAYHTPCARLAGYWCRMGVPLLDAHARLESLFDAVFPPDRDARWESRRNDALRIVADIYRKDETARAEEMPNGADHDDDDSPAEPPPASGPAWPDPLGPAAYYGLPGEIVHTIEPHTEADPAALLFQFLGLAGCQLGSDSYYFVEGARHAPNLFMLIIGASAMARKGTALAQVRRLFDPDFTHERIRSGLSSGEGLIEAVRDPTTKTQKDKTTGAEITVEDDPGVADKRLLIVEEEFARTLRTAARPESTLIAVIRQAWDGHHLANMTRKSPLRATSPHICIIGHITSAELQEELNNTNAVNGLANRFLFCCARRSKFLPFGGSPEPIILEDLRRRLNRACDTAPRRDQARCRGTGTLGNQLSRNRTRAVRLLRRPHQPCRAANYARCAHLRASRQQPSDQRSPPKGRPRGVEVCRGIGALCFSRADRRQDQRHDPSGPTGRRQRRARQNTNSCGLRAQR
jgi:hypothetical protein